MTDSINDRLREAAAKLPPPDPKKAAAKRKEDHDAWEVEAIPKLFEEQPSIETFDGVPQRISMNVLIGYLRNLGKRLGFDDRCKVITFDGKKVSKDHVATIYGRLESIGLAISKEKAKDAVEMVATENRYDPVERYLSNLPWLIQSIRTALRRRISTSPTSSLSRRSASGWSVPSNGPTSPARRCSTSSCSLAWKGC